MNFLSFLIGPMTIIIALTSCQNNAGDNQINEITNNNETVSNFIAENWSNDAGCYSMEWADETGMLALCFTDSTISFLDVQGITFEMLNDTLYKITYPEDPLVIELGSGNQFEFDSLSEVWCESDQFNGYVGARGGMHGNAFDVYTKDIMFGADRIKTKVLGKDKVKIYFPKESFWNIKCINDPLKCLNFYESGIMIYGKKDTMYYEPYEE